MRGELKYLVLLVTLIGYVSSVGIETSGFRYVVSNDPQQLKVPLPKEVEVYQANNCVGIAYFEGRLFMGWRTAPSHFASTKTKVYVISSPDNGTQTWDFEYEVSLGADIREPYLTVFQGNLYFTYFQGGQNPFGFDPQFMFKTRRLAFQNWTQAQKWGQPGEIAWQFQTIGDRVYVSSYVGEHYREVSDIKVYLNYSENFEDFTSVISNGNSVYRGGISELGFTFNQNLDILATGRNEDGDYSGFGSRYFFVPKSQNYQYWNQIFPSVVQSNPDIQESPRMFSWKNYTFLVGRLDLNPPYQKAPRTWPFLLQKLYNLVTYSLSAHTTAIWLLNQQTMKLEFLTELPGDGDTAFPSILQTGSDTFTIANYASPLGHPLWPWIWGQIHPTQLYLIDIKLFE